MTNGERADRILADALPVAEEMRAAIARKRWNLALRRPQEVIELVIKALLNVGPGHRQRVVETIRRYHLSFPKLKPVFP